MMGPRPPVCTDPLCKGCPSISGLRMCPPACPCANVAPTLPPMPPPSTAAPDLTAMLLSYQQLFGSLSTPFSMPPIVPPGTTATAPFVSEATSTTTSTGDIKPATSTQQHVCNWMNEGKGQCGKSFDTAEQLIVHLSSHATTSNESKVCFLLLCVKQSFATGQSDYQWQELADCQRWR